MKNRKFYEKNGVISKMKVQILFHLQKLRKTNLKWTKLLILKYICLKSVLKATNRKASRSFGKIYTIKSQVRIRVGWFVIQNFVLTWYILTQRLRLRHLGTKVLQLAWMWFLIKISLRLETNLIHLCLWARILFSFFKKMFCQTPLLPRCRDLKNQINLDNSEWTYFLVFAKIFYQFSEQLSLFFAKFVSLVFSEILFLLWTWLWLKSKESWEYFNVKLGSMKELIGPLWDFQAISLPMFLLFFHERIYQSLLDGIFLL